MSIGIAIGELRAYIPSTDREAMMDGFQAFKTDSGEYRWRLVEGGRVVPIRPGRVHVAPFPKQTRKLVEAALDRALARLAGEKDVGRSKA